MESQRTPEGSSTHALRAALGDSATIGVGETVLFEGTGVTATFVRVAGDSRCPSDVVCVWQGDGEVVLDIATDGLATRVVLHTGLEPRSASLAGVVVELVTLAPFPVELSPPPEDRAYTVTLVARTD
jgi:hypothetical protein